MNDVNLKDYIRRKKIVICRTCKGAGSFRLRKNPHLKEPDYQLVPCDECEGSGRMVRHTVLTPYKGLQLTPYKTTSKS